MELENKTALRSRTYATL